jgi:hypothetical protein
LHEGTTKVDLMIGFHRGLNWTEKTILPAPPLVQEKNAQISRSFRRSLSVDDIAERWR